jgi:hypothetical protein
MTTLITKRASGLSASELAEVCLTLQAFGRLAVLRELICIKFPLQKLVLPLMYLPTELTEQTRREKPV